MKYILDNHSSIFLTQCLDLVLMQFNFILQIGFQITNIFRQKKGNMNRVTKPKNYRTPIKTPRKKLFPHLLSVPASFDELMKNSSVLQSGAEEQFLEFVKSAKEWRKKWFYAESERKRLNILLIEREKENAALDQKIKQAREMVDVEIRKRTQITENNNMLQRQLNAVHELVNSNGGNHNIDNDTLKTISSKFSLENLQSKTPSRTPRKIYNTPLRVRGTNNTPIVDESAQSLLDASELSYDDSRTPGVLDDSKDFEDPDGNIRVLRSRKSYSMTGGNSVSYIFQ